MTNPTVVPGPLRAALARADAAPIALLAFAIPHCPSCELLPTSFAEIRRMRPMLAVEIALMGSPQDWSDREMLLWPRSIHVSRASVPVMVLLRHGQVVTTRPGGGPAHAIDAWLTEALGPPEHPMASGAGDAGVDRPPAARRDETDSQNESSTRDSRVPMSADEARRLAALDGLRVRHLVARSRRELG